MHSKSKMYRTTQDVVFDVSPHSYRILAALQMKIIISYCPVFYDGYKKAVDLK